MTHLAGGEVEAQDNPVDRDQDGNGQSEPRSSDHQEDDHCEQVHHGGHQTEKTKRKFTVEWEQHELKSTPKLLQKSRSQIGSLDVCGGEESVKRQNQDASPPSVPPTLRKLTLAKTIQDLSS